MIKNQLIFHILFWLIDHFIRLLALFLAIFENISVDKKNLKMSPVILFLNARNIRIVTVCYYHVMYAFQSESTLYCCLNVKEHLA